MKTQASRRNFRAFTLVELLVVISVIIVLIAILMPAMEEAVYQAQLAKCGANLKGVATGMTAYAVGNQTSYPDRSTALMASIIRGDGGDLRPVINQYLAMAMMIDPLCEPVDLTRNAPGNPPKEPWRVFSNYDLYFGWGFNGESTMKRLENRWSWGANDFRVLATDHNRIGANTFAMSSHSDRQGKMTLVKLNGDEDGINVLSRWQMGSSKHAPLDLNFAYQDGSVLRFKDVKPNNPNDAPTLDDRFVQVPNYITRAGIPGDYHNMPRN